jgi:hypothetical protein
MTRRALTIGVNYVGTSSQLAGCVNDAEDWLGVLGDRGFECAVLVDGDATRAHMLDEMASLIAETGPDDLAVITYSGHGSWRVDRDGDEPDRRDEVICPVDYSRAGMIADDDLHKVFTSGHRWARVVFISDSCHSGSVNRLAGPLGDRTTYYEPGVINLKAGSEHRVSAYRAAKFLPPAEWIDNEDDLHDARRVELAPTRGKPRASALLMAACSDVEVAYDAWFSGRANGAFTYAALDALKENPATYRDWQQGIRSRLPSVDYQQTPQLTGGSGQRRWNVLEETGER